MWEKFRSLSLEQKIGQLFFIGLPGLELDAETQDLLREVPAGGVCLFSRNIRAAGQTRRLLDELRQVLPVEPIISLDQEGGLVDRLRRVAVPMPPVNRLGTSGNARRLAEITAELVRILGFNTNFAPVVDLPTAESLNSQNGLQSRCFSATVSEVGALAGAYLETLQENGVFGCPKHFPGIGASMTDPHEDLPIVYLTRAELSGRDLLPYRDLLGRVFQIMIAHAAYPNLDLQERDRDGKLVPSSLSFNIVTKLLRQEMGFQGLVVTDDLEMGAILKTYGIGEACKMALRAGVDMLLICADPEAVKTGYRAVTEAFQRGEVPGERLDESLQRIARFKALMKEPLPFDEGRLAALSAQIARLNELIK
jgi:beta-N-acetylhexosaminidase